MKTHFYSDDLDLISAGIAADDYKWGIDVFVNKDDLLDEIALGWSFNAHSGVIKLSLLFVSIYIGTPLYIPRRQG
jgi:hypothetical protein